MSQEYISDMQESAIDVQVVATTASSHFYSQEMVDAAVMNALESAGHESRSQGVERDLGVKVWRDADEWSVSYKTRSRALYKLTKQDWKKIGDPILHIEVRPALSSAAPAHSSCEDGPI